MAEAPPEGLYPQLFDAELDGDRLEVLGGAFGPAGAASVELPDGSSWEVDHLDPGRLVSLDLDAADPTGSSLLVAAFGGDGAMRLVDRARRRGRLPDDWRPEPGDPRGAGNRGRLAADAAGRLVLLADLAQDPSLGALARILAVVELVASTRGTPGGDLFEPMLADLVDRAESLAPGVDPDELWSIEDRAKRLFLMAQTFDQRFGDRAPDLVDLLADASIEQVAMYDAMPSEAGAPRRAAIARLESVAPAPQLPEEFLGTERVSPSLLVVTVARSADDRWARVLRRDGLVLLAQAPLERSGLVDRAQVLIPPDTRDDEFEVQVVDAEILAALHRRQSDLIRDAVRAGRAAASAERRGDVGRAMRRWDDCAELWAAVGDMDRSELAARRTGTAGGRVRGQPLLVDDLDPYGDDDA